MFAFDCLFSFDIFAIITEHRLSSPFRLFWWPRTTAATQSLWQKKISKGVLLVAKSFKLLMFFIIDCSSILFQQSTFIQSPSSHWGCRKVTNILEMFLVVDMSLCAILTFMLFTESCFQQYFLGGFVTLLAFVATFSSYFLRLCYRGRICPGETRFCEHE